MVPGYITKFLPCRRKGTQPALRPVDSGNLNDVVEQVSTVTRTHSLPGLRGPWVALLVIEVRSLKGLVASSSSPDDRIVSQYTSASDALAHTLWIRWPEGAMMNPSASYSVLPIVPEIVSK